MKQRNYYKYIYIYIILLFKFLCLCIIIYIILYYSDEEVVWDEVRCLKDGETVSLAGTHLGHNLPDFQGNR